MVACCQTGTLTGIHSGLCLCDIGKNIHFACMHACIDDRMTLVVQKHQTKYVGWGAGAGQARRPVERKAGSGRRAASAAGECLHVCCSPLLCLMLHLRLKPSQSYCALFGMLVEPQAMVDNFLVFVCCFLAMTHIHIHVWTQHR